MNNDLYHVFRIKKTSKKFRTIIAPTEWLKYEQRKILFSVLEKIPVHQSAYGFVKGKTILDNAKRHNNKGYVLAMDIKDFFPSIKANMVMKALEDNQIHKELASYITEMCCYEGILPQGAPTSPALSNIVFKAIDKKLFTLAKSVNVKYTRYADDLTFSGDYENITGIHREILRIVEGYGFKINHKKNKLMGAYERQEVTGVCVNKELSVAQDKIKSIRGMLYMLEKNILTNGSAVLPKGISIDYLQGILSYYAFVNKKYKKYYEKFQMIRGNLSETIN